MLKFFLFLSLWLSQSSWALKANTSPATSLSATTVKPLETSSSISSPKSPSPTGSSQALSNSNPKSNLPEDPDRFNLAALCLGGISSQYNEDARSFLASLEIRTQVDPLNNAWQWISEDKVSEAPPMIWIFIHANASISEDLAQALRRYIANGGTVMIECQTPSCYAGLEQLRKKVFPDKQSQSLAEDSLLTRTFYILPDSFSASLKTIRNAGRVVWIESTQPVLAGISNAQGDQEYRTRVGVNMVLYSLTGSYKDDLTHLRYLMRRRKS